MYWIYCHVFPNGKRYVGLTRTGLERRWGHNGGNYKTCVLVDRAINKYGWGNVEHVIIDSANTTEEAEEKERYYIRKYDSDNPAYGYNMLPGGNVATNDATEEMRYKLGKGNRGKTKTEEEKRKISEGVKRAFNRPESNGHIGLKATKEARQKMSESQKATWNDEKRERASRKMKERMADPEYKKRIVDNLQKYQQKPGERHLSDSAKEKLSKFHKGRWIGEKSPTAKPVLQYTKNGELVKRWACAGEAARAGVADRKNINNCCNHKIQTSGGYVWRFENDPILP